MKRTKVLSIFIIIAMLIMMYPNFSEALNENVRVVSSREEVLALLGTTSEKAREENLLGIAGNYSVFVRENFTAKDAETGGRAAVGGKLEATTNYKYQIGSAVYNYHAAEHTGIADIIVGNGPIKNIETQYGATISGENYNMKKKVVVSPDATAMNWNELSDDEISTFVQANAIDFNSEFEFLNNLSTNELVSKKNGNWYKDAPYTFSTVSSISPFNQQAAYVPATSFIGSDKFVNIFNIDADTWNSINDIILDVPYDSYIIINITGDNIVFNGYQQSQDNMFDNMFYEKNILYPISRAEIAGDGIEDSDVAIAIGDRKRACADEDGCPKTFAKLLCKSNKYIDKGAKILFNLPEATNFEIKGNWTGSILAPKANGMDTGKTQTQGAESQVLCGGHISGSIICKNYEGYEEIGNMPFSMPVAYLNQHSIKIDKIDAITREKLRDAIFKISDLNGNTLYKWNSRNANNNSFNLAKGKYIISEIQAPDNYEQINPVAFEVESDGTVQLTSASYKIVENVPVSVPEGTDITRDGEGSISNFINSYEQENNKHINKITFTTDTSAATFLPDWGLYYFEHESGEVGRAFPRSIDWLEATPWTQTWDGKDETVYLTTPLHLKKGIIWFFRGGRSTDDIKVKNLKIGYDTVTTKTISKNDIRNAEVSENVLTIGNNPNTGWIITVTKLDKQSQETIKDVEIGIYSSEDTDIYTKDQLIEKAYTDENGNVEFRKSLIPGGKYYIKEISNLSGYATLIDVINFETSDREVFEETYTMENERIKLEVTKSDFESGNPVIGADLQILNNGGEEVASWKTTSEPFYIEKLPIGKYKLVERKAPDGYEIAEEVEFEIIDTPEVQKVDMADKLKEKEEQKNSDEVDKQEEDKNSLKTGDKIVFIGIILSVAVIVLVRTINLKKKHNISKK